MTYYLSYQSQQCVWYQITTSFTQVLHIIHIFTLTEVSIQVCHHHQYRCNLTQWRLYQSFRLCQNFHRQCCSDVSTINKSHIQVQRSHLNELDDTILVFSLCFMKILSDGMSQLTIWSSSCCEECQCQNVSQQHFLEKEESQKILDHYEATSMEELFRKIPP